MMIRLFDEPLAILPRSHYFCAKLAAQYGVISSGFDAEMSCSAGMTLSDRQISDVSENPGLLRKRISRASLGYYPLP